MKNYFKVFIFSLIICLFPLKLPAAEQLPFDDPNITISMDFQDANLKDILKLLSIQSGLNFIASEDVQNRRITLFLDKVTIKEAMDKLFKANDLSYELDPQSKIFIVKDWGSPQAQTVTEVFCLKYATVSSSSLYEDMGNKIGSSNTSSSSSGSSSSSSSSSSGARWTEETDVGITKAVKKILSNNAAASVTEDYRTNSLIVTDVPARMPAIRALIASLDVPVPQVMLEVEMLDVSKNVVDKLGFVWTQNPFTLTVSGRNVQTFLGSMALRSATIPGAAGAIILGHTFAQTLDYLRTQTDTKFLARPRLLTLNNETAEIQISTDESIGLSSTTQGTTTTTASVERATTGVLLRITPQVNLEQGEITMFIYPEVSEATPGNSFISAGDTYQFRDPEVRSTKSMVRVKDNQTVMLGGMLRNELSIVRTRLPILSDIPIIGALFRHKGGTNDKNKERELIVFVTPHIVKDSVFELAQAKKDNLLSKEQIPVSPSNRQFAIDASLNSFEKIK